MPLHITIAHIIQAQPTVIEKFGEIFLRDDTRFCHHFGQQTMLGSQLIAQNDPLLLFALFVNPLRDLGPSCLYREVRLS